MAGRLLANPAMDLSYPRLAPQQKPRGVELRRFEPDGSSRLRIWLDKAEFDSVIDWIDNPRSRERYFS